MDNIAYLHVAFAYEEDPSNELIAHSSSLNQSAAPDWKRLSSRAWKYLLPLVFTLSILSIVSSALALERGDQGPSVKKLQQQLKKAGFYQSNITQLYDFNTEFAVRRFQKASGLTVDGIAGNTTLEKLKGWRAPKVSNNTAKKPKPAKIQVRASSKPKPVKTQARASSTVVKTTTTTKTSSSTTTSSSSGKSKYLARGAEGKEVRTLQEQLRIAGFYYGNANGIFGSITENAVKKFQAAYKLDVDGIVGPATRKKLPPAGVGFGEDTPKARAVETNKLRLGHRGEVVRVLQAQLIQAGYLQGEPNGYYGPYTADAVRRFQANNYLKPSGIAGPTTRGKLYNLINKDKPGQFDILEVQRRLQARGFYKGPLDGKLGNDTKKAIKNAQEFYGISLTDVRNGSF
ncbi:MAG: peptidoglycan-binding protein [Calothrix sp. MO_167.B12]|nr:peptidoglycan-binding protein [Calothrix sp. MO_167.B12]